MELLIVRNLSLEHQGRTLLQGVDLTLREGMRLGLVGANGSGKSTLLEVVAGRRPAATGRVRRAPGIDLGYLPQAPSLDERQTAWQAALLGIERVTRLEEELRLEEERLGRGEGSLEGYGELREAFERSGGYAAEALLREQLAALGLDEERLGLTVGQLSGGERSRLALARALAATPQLLILDEPTNHLDLPAIRWLGDRLRSWRGALLLVSHDRELLDGVCTHTAQLGEGRLELFRGGYSRMREQQGVTLRTNERRERERRKEAERLEAIAGELRSWGSAGAQRRRRRAQRRAAELQPEARAAGRSTLPAPVARDARGTLLEARHLSSSAGGRRLLADVALTIDAGDKIALLGANGSGKSTLLRMVAGELPSEDPRAEFRWHRDVALLLSGQHDRGLAEEQPVLEGLEELVSGERARMLLALAGLPPESWLAEPGELSGGQRARAGLARLLAAEANLLLLDEPSNDLDLEAIETLHRTVETSDAAVVFATHDRALARLANRVWSLEGGELVEYRGGLDGFLAGRRRLETDVEETAQEQAEEEGGEIQPACGQGDDRVEHLELERLGIEDRLDDPLRLSERERLRLEERRREVLELLSEAYDLRLAPPLPAFSTVECGIRLSADFTEDGLDYSCAAPVEMGLLVRSGVGHLLLREAEGSSLLPWARAALLDAAVRLAFYALALDAVQHHSRAPVAATLLEPASAGWWTMNRRRFEALEGWRRDDVPAGRTPRNAPQEPGRSGGVASSRVGER